MRDIVYAMCGDSPSPQGGGDTRSWFFYYKMRLDEPELFMPLSGTETAKIEEGARIWFVLDGRLVACAPVLRLVEDSFNNTYELWYRGSELTKLDHELSTELHARITTGELWETINEQSPP
jgi:hypothetical protein